MEKKQLQNIRDLLQKVSLISKKYNEIAKITGENYNVFNILNLSTKEVRTHSAFIADLLNVNGLHGQSNIFLKLFLEQVRNKLNVKIKKRIPSDAAEVYIEENIGIISEDEGGRIDIVIKDNINQVVIENKIYAGDEEKQLVRYHNRYPNAILLYLTLQEKEASEKSTINGEGSKLKIKEDYFNITYKKDIKEWLERCKEKSVNQPILRETITQYINLIKQLTGQTMNDKMKNEITKLLANKENFIAGNEIAKNIENAKVNLIKEFEYSLKSGIKEYVKAEIVKNDKRVINIKNDKKNIFGIYFKLKDIYMYIWAYKDYPLHFGIEEIDNDLIFKDMKIDKNNFPVLNDYKKDKEIQIKAFNKEIYLDNFENETTLELFHREKREEIVKQICKEIVSFAKIL